MSSIETNQVDEAPELSPDQVGAVDRIAQRMGRARRLLFITGAGMSADSGLPTYRGRDGLYREHETTRHGLPIERALSGPMLRSRPEITWHYLLELERSTRGAAPHRGHKVLAEMDGYFDAVWVLTQNVDGLHQQAGSRNVIDIHGNLHELLCTGCGRGEVVRDYAGLELPPCCPDCRGPIRPGVVLFDEDLPPEKLGRLWAELGRGFDVIFSIGTTSVFEYIAEPVRVGRRAGSLTVEINPEVTRVSDAVDIRIPGRAAVVLDALWERYLTWWPWT
ncbi:MAG: NAD-dependent protein deacylase [Isosphaeraceae bacterium]